MVRDLFHFRASPITVGEPNIDSIGAGLYRSGGSKPSMTLLRSGSRIIPSPSSAPSRMAASFPWARVLSASHPSGLITCCALRGIFRSPWSRRRPATNQRPMPCSRPATMRKSSTSNTPTPPTAPKSPRLTISRGRKRAMLMLHEQLAALKTRYTPAANRLRLCTPDGHAFDFPLDSYAGAAALGQFCFWTTCRSAWSPRLHP